jgi:hypothetical protein
MKEMYKQTHDEVNKKYGGMNALENAIKMAKLKEEAVAGLLSKLEFVLVSFFGLIFSNRLKAT